MFPLTEARGGGNGGMSKDEIRKWEDLATEDRVAGCPGYVSQKVSLHQIFLWFHFLTSGLTLESQIHVMLQENEEEEMHPSRPPSKHTARADWGLKRRAAATVEMMRIH